MKQMLLKIKGREIELVEKKPRRLEAYIDDPWALPQAVASLLRAYPDGVYISAITAVDLPQEESIELDYIFWVIPERTVVLLRTRVPRVDPRAPSIAGLLPGASVYEQEVYDLMGVAFDGGEGLRRIFAPLDAGPGYPLRKDWKEG